MPRRRQRPQADPLPPAVPVIDPRAVYRPVQLQAALGLDDSTIPREIREGRLRACKRAGRVYILGAWVLRWLRSAPPPRSAPGHAGEATPTTRARQRAPARVAGRNGTAPTTST